MTAGTGDEAPQAAADSDAGDGPDAGRTTNSGRWARYWAALQEHNPIWAFLLRVMSIEPQDCRGAERTFPMLLLCLAIANGCVALFTVPAAIGVIAEQTSVGARHAGGLVAAVFIFLIDLIVVSQHPHPPRWLPAIRIPHLEDRGWFRSRTIPRFGPAQSTLGYWLPPMPAFPQRLLSMAPRLVLTLGIAVVIGGGMNLAINKGAIAYQKNIMRLDEVKAQNDAADADYQENLKALKADADDAAARLAAAEQAFNLANTLYGCELGHRENVNCGNIQSTNGEGTRLARNHRRTASIARDQAAAAAERAAGDLEKLRALGAPSTRPDNKLSTPDTSGWQRTKAAFDRYAASQHLGWYEKYLPELVLGGIDLIPLLIKLFGGYPAYDSRRWIRQHDDILRLRRPLTGRFADEYLAATEAAVDLAAYRSTEARQIAVDTAVRLARIRGDGRIRQAEQEAARDRNRQADQRATSDQNRHDQAARNRNRHADQLATGDRGRHADQEAASEQWQSPMRPRAGRPHGGSAADPADDPAEPAPPANSTEVITGNETGQPDGPYPQLGDADRFDVESVDVESEPGFWSDWEDETQVFPEDRRSLVLTPRLPDDDMAPWDDRSSWITPELDAPWDTDVDFEDRPWFESNGRWVIGPPIAPDAFHREGSHLYLAIRRNENASRPERFDAFADCAVLKVVGNPQLQRVELSRHGQVNSNSLVRSRSRVTNIQQLVEAGHVYENGLLYDYHPRTDAERYLGSQAMASGGEGHPVKYRNLVRWMLPPAYALEVIWSAGYAHNDVKPRNLIITGPYGQPQGFVQQGNQNGDMLLCDLDALGALGTPAGTPGPVRAPECMDVDLPMGSVAADTYSFGSSIFFFLTGRTPNQVVDAPLELSRGEWFRFHLGTDFREFLPDGVPDALADAVLQFIATRPEERLVQQPAMVLEDSLRSILEDSTYLFHHPAYQPDWAPSGWSDETKQLIRDSGYLDPDAEGE